LAVESSAESRIPPNSAQPAPHRPIAIGSLPRLFWRVLDALDYWLTNEAVDKGSSYRSLNMVDLHRTMAGCRLRRRHAISVELADVTSKLK
jgi:hypothetical protein